MLHTLYNPLPAYRQYIHYSPRTHTHIHLRRDIKKRKEKRRTRVLLFRPLLSSPTEKARVNQFIPTVFLQRARLSHTHLPPSPPHARQKAAPSFATPHSNARTPSPPLAAQHSETHGPPSSHDDDGGPVYSERTHAVNPTYLRNPASVSKPPSSVVSGPLPRPFSLSRPNHPLDFWIGRPHPSAKRLAFSVRVRTELGWKQIPLPPLPDTGRFI